MKLKSVDSIISQKQKRHIKALNDYSDELKILKKSRENERKHLLKIYDDYSYVLTPKSLE